MRFVSAGLEGVFLVEPEPQLDERGSFARIWCRDELDAHGLDSELAQCSISRNERAGTLRGLHLQRPPHEETKLVLCTQGAIFDVIVDLRAGSATYLEWFGAELDAVRGSALYVPKGCAHGYQTLTESAEVLYLISDPYVPEASSGVRWDDPAFSIDWPPAPVRTISERDRAWPSWSAG